mmetsp:Transcript_24571/g.29968  ORF Transcript_24571/g.29968 Transcript_24571/m.29968 type:complete len:503 (+) Transcript_24571:87-1595(+)
MQNTTTKKRASVYTGKVSNYDWSCHAGTIMMDDGKTIEFGESNCIGFVNFNDNVNVSFKIRYNNESQLYEAYGIKMTKQDVLNGYISGIDYANGIGYIRERYSNGKANKFSRRSCKEFDRLVMHDFVTYSWHYGRKINKIVNIKLNEKENIVKRNARGFVSGIKFYDDKKFILVFVYVGSLKRNVCVRLNGIKTKFVRGLHVRLNVFEDAFKTDNNGHMLYGKDLRCDVYDVFGKAIESKASNNIINSNNGRVKGAKAVKRSLIINTESKENIITLNGVRKERKVVSLDDIMKQESSKNNNNNNNVNRKGAKAKIAKRDASIETENRINGITWDSIPKGKAVSLNVVMEQEITEENVMRNNESGSINKSINNIESSVDEMKTMVAVDDTIVTKHSGNDIDGDDSGSENNSDDNIVKQDNDVKNDESTKQESNKKGIITIDMINDFKKRIHGLNIQLAKMVQEYKIQRYNEINQEIMDITSNCDFNSDFNESINDSQYSHASQ